MMQGHACELFLLPMHIPTLLPMSDCMPIPCMQLSLSELMSTNRDYAEKVEVSKSTEKILMLLAWDVKELDDLNQKGREFLSQCSIIEAKLIDPGYDAQADNLSRQLTSLSDSVCKYLRRVGKFTRVAATHVLVIVISTEESNQKPYALPVQCLAYRSLKDAEVRAISNKVIDAMTERKMKVAGLY